MGLGNNSFTYCYPQLAVFGLKIGTHRLAHVFPAQRIMHTKHYKFAIKSELFVNITKTV